MAQNMHYHSKGRGKQGIGGESWAKAKPQPSRASSKSYSSLTDVKGLRWLCPSSFANWNTHLSLAMLLTPSLKLWLADFSHSSSISNILGSLMHCHSFNTQGLPCRTPGPGGRCYNPSTPVSFMTLKPEPQGQCSQVELSAWSGTCPLLEWHPHKWSLVT